MPLLLIPLYWACAIGLILANSPTWEALPSTLSTFTGLALLSTAAVLSAETFLWWQTRAKLLVHFRQQWRAGLLRSCAGVITGAFSGLFGLFVGLLVSMTAIGNLAIGLVFLFAGSLFIWVQAHRYLIRVAG